MNKNLLENSVRFNVVTWLHMKVLWVKQGSLMKTELYDA